MKGTELQHELEPELGRATAEPTHKGWTCTACFEPYRTRTNWHERVPPVATHMEGAGLLPKLEGELRGAEVTSKPTHEGGHDQSYFETY